MTASRSQPPGQGTPTESQPVSVPRQQGTQAGQQPDPGGREPGAGPAPAEDQMAAMTLGRLGGDAWLAVLSAAVVMVAVGIVLLVWPKATLTIVAILLGIALIVTGLLRLFDGFTARGGSAGMRAAYVLIGLLACIAGLYCVRHHSVTLFLLAFVVGVFWVVHGVADLAAAAMSGPFPGRGLRAIGGLVSLAAGLIVVFWPSISLVLMLTIFGIWLIFYGVVLGGLALRLRRESAPAAGQDGSGAALHSWTL
jgi:uncharacterized membrane protein HdeD (DUF308 family)